jgi:hypothetical protein
MKKKPACLLLVVAAIACAFCATAQTNLFTYQGRLLSNGAVAEGLFDVRFTLFDAETGVTAVAGPVTNPSVIVSNGLFTTPVDFGTNVYDGTAYWLELAVRPSGTPDLFVTLAPRQALTPVPYALHAPKAKLADKARTVEPAAVDTEALADASVTGAKLAERGISSAKIALGAVTSNELSGDAVTSDKIADGSVGVGDLDVNSLGTTFWKATGNASLMPGTHFLGTTDNQPLDVRVNNQSALRLLPTPTGHPNLIGGASNAIGTDVRGATVAGGYLHSLGDSINAPAIGGGFQNNIGALANAATIAGGAYNTNRPGANGATIGGGSYQMIQAGNATIAGGLGNSIRSAAGYSAIGGGEGNDIGPAGHHATIGGGYFNAVGTNADYATIPGGALNVARGDFSFAAGYRANADHAGVFVWADALNTNFASTTSNQFNVRASGGVRFETGGAGATVDGLPVVAGQVGAAQLADGAVSASKLAAGSVTASAIENGAVGNAQLADGAVSATKVATVSKRLPITIANPTPENSDQFGVSVAAVGSDRLLIGAYSDNADGPDAGAAHLFSTNGSYLMSFARPGTSIHRSFGYAVAAMGNDRVWISAPGDQGAVYLFSVGPYSSGLVLTTITNTPGSFFGGALAIAGDGWLLVGASSDNTGATASGVVHLFTTNGARALTITNPTPAIGDSFGRSVAAVGNALVLIGAPEDDAVAANSGVAHLYSTNGTRIRTFINPNPKVEDYFGVSLAAMGGDRVLFGAPGYYGDPDNTGAAYLFSTNGTLLTTFTNPVPSFTDNFGAAVVTVGGDRVLIGDWFKGAVHVFDTNGVLLETLRSPRSELQEGFGYSVAEVGTDRMLVGAYSSDIGAAGSGAAYLFSTASFAEGLIADAVRVRSITSAHLDDGVVTTSKLANDAVTGMHISDGTITINDLSSDTLNRTFWKLGGNAGTLDHPWYYLGTTDDRPCNIMVNDQRALRLEPTSGAPNLIGGSASNSVAAGVEGAVISGGGASSGAQQIAANFTTIGGGLAHGIRASAGYGTISGGRQNTLQTNAQYGAIGGGYLNAILSDSQYAMVDGGYRNLIETNSAYAIIGGGRDNTNGPVAHYATISGGYWNRVYSNAQSAVIAGGIGNSVSNNAQYATIGGGYSNRIFASANYTTIAGGTHNTNGQAANYATIGGGWQNEIRQAAESSVIAGGYRNVISNGAAYCVIAGGRENRIAGAAWQATVAGGHSNLAAGYYSFAAGQQARAVNYGSFVWSDGSVGAVPSFGDNTFTARAAGGARFYTIADLSVGVNLPAGGGAWAPISDRAVKDNVRPVDGRDVLEKVAALPLNTWNYKSQDASIRHIGPMAQDFHAAFGVGEDERHITTVDADGVALAAIQGLNKKLEQELRARDAEIGELKRTVSEMRQLMQRREGE